MSHIEVSERGCWLWTNKRDRDGYGFMRGRRAHRVSYEIHIGPIQDGLCVLHRCDTPSCVNPDHLFADTQLANMADMHAKGRNGGFGARSKLSDADVASIKRIYADGDRNQYEIAKDFGVTQSTISKVLLGNAHRECFAAAKNATQRKESPARTAENAAAIQRAIELTRGKS